MPSQMQREELKLKDEPEIRISEQSTTVYSMQEMVERQTTFNKKGAMDKLTGSRNGAQTGR